MDRVTQWLERLLHVHRGRTTSSVMTTPGNIWYQETCSCGAKRQYMTHRWGKSGPTQWVVR